MTGEVADGATSGNGRFLEVTSPTIEMNYGGAEARPFTVVGGSSELDTVVEMASAVPDADRGPIESLRRWLGSWR